MIYSFNDSLQTIDTVLDSFIYLRRNTGHSSEKRLKKVEKCDIIKATRKANRKDVLSDG